MASVRVAASAVVALGLVGLMFWFLHFMVGRHTGVGELKAAARIEFTRLRRDTEVQSRRQEKAKLELRQEVPTPQLAARAGPSSAGAGAVVPVAVQASASVAAQKLGVARLSGGSDRDAVPLVRIEPEYPPNAADRGVEGWVLLRFTITPVGTVKDAVVVDASPTGVFDAAALKAVSRWKYNPKVEEGVAVERRGVQVILRFKVEKQK